MSEGKVTRKTEVKTSTLVGLAMLAGVGLTNIEVSRWATIGLDTTSILFERVTDVVSVLVGVDKSEANHNER
jgi:hypothetical protein